MQRFHSPAHAALLTLFGFLMYSIVDGFGKNMTAEINVFEISFWGSLTGIAFLIGCAPWLGGLSPTLRTEKKAWHLARALLSGFVQPLNFFALASMPLVNFYTIIFTAPFITVALAAAFFKEKVSFKTWALILAGFCGVLVAMRPAIDGIGLPEIAVLLSAALFSIRNMTVQKMGKQETLLSYGLDGYVGIAVVSFLALHGQPQLPPPDTWPLLFVSGILGAAGMVAVSVGFRIGPATLVAPMHYSQIIWGILFGALFFTDFPDLWDLIGAGIVCVCGMLLIERRGIKASAEPDF